MGSLDLSERELVRQIARDKGHLGEDKLAQVGAIEPELRRAVEEALLRKDAMIGSAVLTLARNLYTSNVGFVFELLQNADGNNFNKAIARGNEPYVSFGIRPDRLCIECNEDGFSLENLHAIYGRDILVPQKQSELHLQKTGGQLRIYVPHDLSTQGSCYFSTLPRRLLEWMMTGPKTLIAKDAGSKAMHVVASVLNAPIINVPQILEAEGIVEVEVPDDAHLEAVDKKASFLILTNSTSWKTKGFDFGSSSTPPLFVFGSPPVLVEEPSASPPLLEAALAITSDEDDDAEYLKRIDEVIASEKTLPVKGVSLDITTPFGHLLVSSGDVESFQRWKSRSSQEPDHLKTRALGELFVFELLTGLSLPGFGRDNWQSTIRKFVTIHPKYSDMSAWKGGETADLVYHDKDRVLTELLIKQGYLEGPGWLKKVPRYFIEVKCTTGKASTLFYISKSQYKRMQDCVFDATSPFVSPTVYLLARVFNMNKANVGLQIYAIWRGSGRSAAWTLPQNRGLLSQEGLSSSRLAVLVWLVRYNEW
ncbi:hypothetical protein EDB81DRAFT_932665 [Dactylonectria macrodidyma]|uniref:Protein NO VEIN C-terminal domain-containing protein n=1 Tax=Dactylonectria macrodidyma TaxID=307937 RepID=A0A9P9J9N3_9HYPO|nr:hypothetical protein EDB81DRAFT_932665 [Dactylonectria macrodidyma]